MKIHGAREARAVGCQSVTSPSTVQDDVPGQGERWVPGGILRPTSQMRALPQAIRDQEPTCPCVDYELYAAKRGVRLRRLAVW